MNRLLDATEVELREVGVEALTVRTVAQRAGVSSATAYTYFTSKDHLFAQLFLRHLLAQSGRVTASFSTPDGDPAGSGAGDVAERLRVVTRAMMADLDAAPELAAAATRALLGSDSAVEPVRLEVGAVYRGLFRDALGGEGLEDGRLEALLLMFLGALLEAGMGAVTYRQAAEQLDRAASLLVEAR